MKRDILRSSKTLICVALFALGLTSKADTGTNFKNLNINQYVQIVEETSPQIQKSKAFYEEQSAKKTESKSAYLPTLLGSVNYLTNKKYALIDIVSGGTPSVFPQIVPTTQYTLSARWNVFDGFASTNRYLSASENEQSAYYDFVWSQFQTKRLAVVAYYKALAARLLKQVADQNVKSLADHHKDVESLKKAGIATEYELLRTEVMSSDAQSELLNAEDMVVVSSQKLNELVLSSDQHLDVAGELPLIDESMLVSFKTPDINQKADLLSLQKKVSSANEMSRSLNKHWYPKLNLFADYNFYNNRNDQFSDTNNFRESYMVGINLTWNLFDGFGSYAKTEQAYSQKAQLEKALIISQRKAQNEVEQWKRKFLYFCSVYKSKNIDIKRSNEALRLAKMGRKAGTRTNTEILDAQADLYRSKAGLINAQIGAIEALVNLELASGEEIYSFIK